ncbi:LysR family transcriptional regulator [Gorillibacterium timonense]|uniref:LysR family transcriptional regulator n=1 Tax=Gorillibacterium timonense TaxID=1689269 RepID=UPI00071E3B43|nr:LysR family transcriptional regulator [Gorillibacterium timonense]
MNLEQLECIVEVAKTGSLTRTAEARLMTVAGVSRAITLLEQELNMKIFVRSRSGAVQTPEGEMIIQKAKIILKEVQELRTEAQNYNQINNAKIRIGTIPGPITLLVEVLTQMKKEFPNLQLEIIESPTVELIHEVTNGSLDAALILLSNVNQKYPNLHFDEIMEGDIVIGVSKSSPLAAKQSVSPTELLPYSFVLYDDKYITKLVSVFGEPLDILFKTNQVEAIYKAVKENIAVTIATDYTIKGYPWMQDSMDIVMIPLNIPDLRKHYLYGVRTLENANHQVLDLFMKRVRHLFR